MRETETGNTETRWQDKTLKAAGYGYLLGDAALAASGFVKGKAGREVLVAGALWGVGGVGAAVYGNPSTEKQLEILAHKLEKYLVAHGAHVSDSARDHADLLRGKNGLGAKIDRFMYEHPSEILNTAYAVGAGMLIKDGLREIANAGKHALPKALNKAAFGNVSSTFWLGGLVLAGALGGLLIKEDADARAKVDPSSITSRIGGFFQEKPLRWSGSCYWMGNLFALKKAFDEKAAFTPGSTRFGMKPHQFSFLTVAAYVVSNGLLFASSRDQIREEKFKPEHVAQLEQVAAEIIAAQPPQVQAQLLTSVSHYLAKEKMVAIPPEELSRQLIARVSEASRRHLAQGVDNRWAGRVAASTEPATALVT